MVDVTEEYVMKAVGMCGIHGLHGTSAMIMDLMKERDMLGGKIESLRTQLATAREHADELIKALKWVADPNVYCDAMAYKQEAERVLSRIKEPTP